MIKVVVEVLEIKIYIYSLSKVIIYLVFFNTDSMCKIHVVADNFLNTYIITHFLVGNFESVIWIGNLKSNASVG